MDDAVQEIVNHGAGVVALAAMFVGGAYVLWRLFAKTDGIITGVGKAAVDYINRTAESIDALAASAEVAHAGIVKRNEVLEDIAETARGNLKENDRQRRVGKHAIDLAENALQTLGVEDQATKDHIASIRRLLMDSAEL